MNTATAPVLRITAPFGAALLVRSNPQHPAAYDILARVGGTMDQLVSESRRVSAPSPFGRVFRTEAAAANYAAGVQGRDRAWVTDMLVTVLPDLGGFRACVVNDVAL